MVRKALNILQQIDSSYFSKMILENSRNKYSLLELQYQPENLDVDKICFAKLPEISNMHEESEKNESVAE